MLNKILKFSTGYILGVLFMISCGSTVSQSIADVIGSATNVTFSSETSNLESTTVQGVIEEMESRLNILDYSDENLQEYLIGDWEGTGSWQGGEIDNINLSLSSDNSYTCSGSAQSSQLEITSDVICGNEENWSLSKRIIKLAFEGTSGDQTVTSYRYYYITYLSETTIEFMALGQSRFYTLIKSES